MGLRQTLWLQRKKENTLAHHLQALYKYKTLSSAETWLSLIPCYKAVGVYCDHRLLYWKYLSMSMQQGVRVGNMTALSYSQNTEDCIGQEWVQAQAGTVGHRLSPSRGWFCEVLAHGRIGGSGVLVKVPSPGNKG